MDTGIITKERKGRQRDSPGILAFKVSSVDQGSPHDDLSFQCIGLPHRQWNNLEEHV